MRKYAFLLAGLLLSCGSPDQPKQETAGTYFDLKSYFNKEAQALNRRGPMVKKSVVVNDKAEEKQLKITDWVKELSVFMDADINKPAWKGEFQTINNANGTSYRSNNDQVPVKQVDIIKAGEKVKGVTILIHNSNYLYSSTDTLSYYPDSLYQIRKSQQIKLLSPKRYRITGTF